MGLQGIAKEGRRTGPQEVHLEEVRKGVRVEEGYRGSHTPRGRQGKEADSEGVHTVSLLAEVRMMKVVGIRHQAPHLGMMAAARKEVRSGMVDHHHGHDHDGRVSPLFSQLFSLSVSPCVPPLFHYRTSLPLTNQICLSQNRSHLFQSSGSRWAQEPEQGTQRESQMDRRIAPDM